MKRTTWVTVVGLLVGVGSVPVTGSAAAVGGPKLEATLTVPESVEIGQMIPITYTVRNTGDAPAKVVIQMATVRSWSNLFDVFTNTPPGGSGEEVRPGKAATSKINVPVDGAGTVAIELTATGTGGLKAKATARVKVLAPKLKVTITGPAEVGLHKMANYVVEVRNAGDLAAENVEVVFGKGDPSRFATIGPGEAKGIGLSVYASVAGGMVQQATATDKHGGKATAECRTVVKKPAPKLRVLIDLVPDPHLPGAVVYQVHVVNDGYGTARSVVLECELPVGRTAAAVAGPVAYLERIGVDFNRPGPVGNRSTVTFEPVPKLGAGEAVVFQVRTTAGPAGAVRFKTALTADHLKAPLKEETETIVPAK